MLEEYNFSRFIQDIYIYIYICVCVCVCVCVCLCVKPNRRHGFPSKQIVGINFYVTQNTKHTKI
jgi:hypothetical protein